MSQAKSCMDQLFVEGSRHDIPITSERVEDATGTVKISTTDMIINAISDMTKRSGAFRYFQQEAPTSQINNLQARFSPLEKYDKPLPQVYIRGSISQADNNVLRESDSAGVTVPFASIGVGQDQSVDTISIDLQLVDMKDRTVLPGVTTSNTITVVSDSDSESARGLIQSGSMGAAISVSLAASRREGRGQAVRTLLEYSLIELLGKYSHVPYHRCLELPSTDPASIHVEQDYYDTLSPDTRIWAVQRGLVVAREYSGPADGMMSDAFKAAVTAAKLKRNLSGDGRVDFQLFNALYDENVIPPQNAAAQAIAVPVPANVTGTDPFGLSLSLDKASYNRGDTVSVRATVNAPAQLYCYYEYHERGALQVARIFPNRFQPDNHLVPGRAILIPRPQDKFQISVDGTQADSIACVATLVEYKGAKRLPFLDEADLEPISHPVGWDGLGYPLFKHQEVDSLQTSVRKVKFQAGR